MTNKKKDSKLSPSSSSKNKSDRKKNSTQKSSSKHENVKRANMKSKTPLTNANNLKKLLKVKFSFFLEGWRVWRAIDIKNVSSVSF
jgi:hypothetical protein